MRFKRTFFGLLAASTLFTVSAKTETAHMTPTRIDLEGIVQEFDHSKGLGQSHDYWGKITVGEDSYEFKGHGNYEEKLFKQAYKKQEKVYVQCVDEALYPCKVQAVKK